jgi:hypothetical protein
MKKTLVVLTAVVLVCIIACSKKDSPGNNTGTDSSNPAYDLVKGSLSVVPFDTADVTALVPLGNLNPPAHTFPTDHMYFYCFTSKPSLEIKSPGNVHIMRIGRTHYNAGGFNDHYDYNIAMGSDNIYMYWGHVSSLSPRLQAAVNNFAGVKCEGSYSTGGSTFEQCFMSVSISATAGEVLGMATTNNGLAGMDLGVTVNKIGADPLEYFDAKARAMLEPKLGRYDGKIKRTVAPLSGEFLLDITGTAQGNWIKLGGSKNPEDNNIALVKDNVTPGQPAFSIGSALPGINSGVYFFDPQNSGLINRRFSDVTADGNTYCYTIGYPNFPFAGNTLIPNASIILKLETGTTLSLEKRNCDCSCTPYVFGANKVSYSR